MFNIYKQSALTILAEASPDCTVDLFESTSHDSREPLFIVASCSSAEIIEGTIYLTELKTSVLIFKLFKFAILGNAGGYSVPVYRPFLRQGRYGGNTSMPFRTNRARMDGVGQLGYRQHTRPSVP